MTRIVMSELDTKWLSTDVIAIQDPKNSLAIDSHFSSTFAILDSESSVGAIASGVAK